MIELTTLEELTKFIASNEKVAIDVFATWCGPCKKIAPYFEQLSTLFPSICFAKVNCDTVELDEFRIQSLPTFLFFVNGKDCDRIIGANKDGLNSSLAKL